MTEYALVFIIGMLSGIAGTIIAAIQIKRRIK